METKLKLEELIRAYLLGNLPLEEQEKLEEQLMTQDDTFTQVLIHEDELIDEYISGSLSEQEREAFERHFLAAPERRQKLGFAQALTKYVKAIELVPATNRVTLKSFVNVFMSLLRLQHPVLRYSLAAIALALTVGIPWSILNVWKLQIEIGKIRDHQATSQIAVNNLTQQLSTEQKRNQDLMEQLGQKEKNRSVSEEQMAQMQLPAMVSFPLTPGQVRDLGEVKKLAIPRAARLVELSLTVDGENYTNYRAILQVAGGEEILSLNRLNLVRKDGVGVVLMPIPAGLLGSGDYIVKLIGLKPGSAPEDIGNYYFRLSKK